MSAEPARAYLGIGEVLALLRADFPDVSVSKIRFLENEGLIQPARSPSRYRKFAPADVERLRYILTAQRDQYLPLRVIKDQLDAVEEEARPAGQARRRGRPGSPTPPGPLWRELLEATGLDEAQLAELRIRWWRSGRHYGPDALAPPAPSCARQLRRPGQEPAGAARRWNADRAIEQVVPRYCASAAQGRGPRQTAPRSPPSPPAARRVDRGGARRAGFGDARPGLPDD
jgi:DNA-binding transcriptional MerR regulator